MFWRGEGGGGVGGGELFKCYFKGLCVLVSDFLMCLLVVCFYMKTLDNNDLNQS